ncbi:hypothetical protein G3578_09150 [Brevibacillus sp. SYP-B805]|uniref:hypothetical protein n=1 Tax=Brevibacillus sp. SYP-B805 TaxID=1578199 RepID=UPI0013EE1796|nr:hypothetical protein [Brevibacillus sp. SYP-B805]NGQ95320.1 hypothetical protein [Brevibacillus sp. SYP-B805]
MINDNLIFPILDLIRQEIRKASIAGDAVREGGDGGGTSSLFDPFSGIPSVILERNQPNDTYRVMLSKATMVYESNWVVEWEPMFGYHPQTGSAWALTEVKLTAKNPQNEAVAIYSISLNYDKRGLLESTSVHRLSGEPLSL